MNDISSTSQGTFTRIPGTNIWSGPQGQIATSTPGINVITGNGVMGTFGR